MSGSEPNNLIGQHASGALSDAGKLLDAYRNYLSLLAAAKTQHVAATNDVSDVVQETLIEACRDFKRFRGSTEAELLAWLRKMLTRNLTDQARYRHAQKRDRRRETSLEQGLDLSADEVHEALTKFVGTPSQSACRRELTVLLSDAVATLPDSARQVIVMRHFHNFSFPEIGQQLGKTAAAVRMTWVRALEQLRKAMASVT